MDQRSRTLNTGLESTHDPIRVVFPRGGPLVAVEGPVCRRRPSASLSLLVYTSHAKLRTRPNALGAHIMGSATLLNLIATVSGTMEPTATGTSARSLRWCRRRVHYETAELPTICNSEAGNCAP